MREKKKKDRKKKKKIGSSAVVNRIRIRVHVYGGAEEKRVDGPALAAARVRVAAVVYTIVVEKKKQKSYYILLYLRCDGNTLAAAHAPRDVARRPVLQRCG